MGLEKYYQKRDFNKTTEPKGQVHKSDSHLFIIQKHAARNLHYDFRIELDGVLKSWAVPKGPSLDPKVKRLAMHVEDHPIEYGNFEGIIPKGEYGAGTVMLWDKGYWEACDENPKAAYKKGHLRLLLHGKKLEGRWDLFRFKKEDKNDSWFLVKFDDGFARKDKEIVEEEPESVISGKTLEEIKETSKAVWTQEEGLTLAKAGPFKFVELSLKPSPLPQDLSPELATLVGNPPEGDQWLHEIKLDGYRILAYKNKKKVTLLSRNKKNWTGQFQAIADKLAELPIDQLILDGEMVVLDKSGRSRFQLLQNAIKGNKDVQFVYYVFDILYYHKWDVCRLPLLKRKELIEPLLLHIDPTSVRYNDHIVGNGEAFYKRACEFGLEGIISKRIDSLYVNKRTKSWLKEKCICRQEFVIGGFTQPSGSRKHFGALLLGYYNNEGELIYAGKVGTGFTIESLKNIYKKLKLLITKKNCFKSEPPGSKDAVWVKPELVAEVAFTEWTDDNHLRHPSFKGLRDDKNAKEVILEKEKPVTGIKQEQKTQQGKKAVKLSNPGKILYPEDKITKQQIYDYYEEICPFIMPFIKNRPLTLVRCPDNYKECFYQKHVNLSSSKALKPIPIKSQKGKATEDYHYLNDEAGLLGLVQMGVLEIHPWGSTIHHLEKPDIIIFDIDPGPDVSWERVGKAAIEIRDSLLELKLTSFLKTTGGKGLHVVIPIKPEHDWDVMKQFSKLFVEFLEQRSPDNYVTNMSKARRQGKIFLDYLRNQRNATAIAPYSTRAKIHAPIATPIDWDELTPDIKDTLYTIESLPKRLRSLKHDPWKNFWEAGKQRLDIGDSEV